MTSWQGVVGMHNIPRNPTGLAREKIVSLHPSYSGSIERRNLTAGEQPGPHNAGVLIQLQKTRLHNTSRRLFGMKQLDRLHQGGCERLGKTEPFALGNRNGTRIRTDSD